MISPIASIIIPTYKRPLFINTCLESIIKNTTIDFEIIVIDSTPKNTLKDLIKKFQDKRIKFVHLKKNLGPTEKRNLGVQKSKGRYLVFLDSDTRVGVNWLKSVIKFLDSHPKIAGGQLKLLKMQKQKFYDSAGEKITRLGNLVERARDSKDNGQFDQVEPIFSGKMAAMIFKKADFKKAGGLDNDFFILWEEPDFCWRIWKTGKQLAFLPQGTVFHGYNIRKNNKDWQNRLTFFGCRNQITTIIKNSTGARGLIFLVSAFFAWNILLLGFLIKFDFLKVKSIINAYYYLINNFNKILIKRKSSKKLLGEDFYSDNQWFTQLIVKKNLSWYFGKGVNYLLQKPF